MKQILLLRHAKSSWDNSNLSDFERPLANRGIRDAKKLCKFIKKSDLKLDKVLCSNAFRAKETFDLTADGFNFQIDCRSTEHTDEEKLQAKAPKTPEHFQELMEKIKKEAEKYSNQPKAPSRSDIEKDLKK